MLPWLSWRTAGNGAPQGTAELGERRPLFSNSSKVRIGAALPETPAPHRDVVLANANAVASSAASRVTLVDMPMSGETSETSAHWDWDAWPSAS